MKHSHEQKLPTYWRERNSKIWSFFCPQCRSPKRVAYRPKPEVSHYIQVALTAVVFTLLSWHWFEWKGIVSFLPLWIAFEAVYRSKTRAALACSDCGFDPFLYLVDVKRARAEIESHWRKKFADKGIPYPEKSADSPKPRAATAVSILTGKS